MLFDQVKQSLSVELKERYSRNTGCYTINCLRDEKREARGFTAGQIASDVSSERSVPLRYAKLLK
jgi:hypothetical protein